jgi:hypothetical protein
VIDAEAFLAGFGNDADFVSGTFTELFLDVADVFLLKFKRGLVGDAGGESGCGFFGEIGVRNCFKLLGRNLLFCGKRRDCREANQSAVKQTREHVKACSLVNAMAQESNPHCGSLTLAPVKHSFTSW